MTHTNEQERAEFLKANIRGPFNEALNHREQGIAFAAWQAARRAQGVPRGWKLVPEESTEAMARAFRADDAPYYFAMTTIRCNDFAERWRAVIHAAPQPPEATVKDSLTVEAAPVQMPLHAAEMVCSDLVGFLQFNEAAMQHTRVDGVQKLYTEQQVRELLGKKG